MNEAYSRLLRNLNVVQWELKERNDSSLNLCIKYIKDAIVDAGKLNRQIVVLESMEASRKYNDEIDNWSED